MKPIVAVLVAAGELGASAAFAQKGETVRIAWLDPLSGLTAAVGTNQLKTFQFFAEECNKKNSAGVKFEIIGIDNKLSPQELRGRRSRPDQRQVQLLALPARRRYLHEDGDADHLHEGAARDQEGLEVRQGNPETQAPRYRDRRRRPASAGAGARLQGVERRPASTSKFYSCYAATTGTPTAMGAASDGKVYQIGYTHYNGGGVMRTSPARPLPAR